MGVDWPRLKDILLLRSRPIVWWVYFVWIGMGTLALGFVIGGMLLVVSWFGSDSPRPVPAPVVSSPTPRLILPTATPLPPLPTLTATIVPTSTPDGPTGKIVFACQLQKDPDRDQVCMINADGSGYQQLTTLADFEHFYPSLAPDGKSFVYVSNFYSHFDVFESDFSGQRTRLTKGLGEIYAPEISPDGSRIVFARHSGERVSIWVMDRDGGNLRQVFASSSRDGWDPTWSPDGKQILFASNYNAGAGVQLFVINLDGSGMRQVGEISGLRGRSDWSPDGQWIVTYSGTPWTRELYLIHPDGTDLHQVSPAGGNSQGPAFSPDGRWIVFTAYFNEFRDRYGCELYIVRVDGSDLRRLTDSDTCSWQPRWGP
jgi:TolB protein